MNTTESKVTTIDDVATEPVKPVKIKPSGKPTGRPELTGEKVTLTIHATGDFDGRDAVNIGHNERVYQVPRGTPCVVPKAVAQIIVDAVQDRTDVVDGKVITSPQPRFPYTITPA